MAANLVEARRQHLTVEVERCRACGDRRGLADASASLEIDFCGLDGDVVGFECPIGCIDTRGCSAYERAFSWPRGAIA